MEIVTLLAIMGGIATVAGAIKALPVITSFVSKTIQFIQSLDDIQKIEYLEDQSNMNIDELTKSFSQIRVNTDDIEKIRAIAEQFNTHKSDYVHYTINIATTIFKAQATQSKVPSFIFKIGESAQDRFVWGNKAWYDLYGFNPDPIIQGQVWDAILATDELKVRGAIASVTFNPSEFRVKYHIENQKTKKITTVTTYAWPLVPSNYNPGDDVLYVGGIEETAD